jgi:hypothetical protein
MRGLHLFHGIVLVSTLALGMGAAQRAHAVSPAIVLDQSFTVPSSFGAVINDCCRFVAQTFTAGLSGTLAGVNLSVESASSFPLHVAIRTVQPSGVPSSTVLGETTLSSSSAPLSLLITFPQTIQITAGVQYAIVVNYEGAPPPERGRSLGSWPGGAFDGYPAGRSFASFADGISWFENLIDLHFRTYVTAITDEVLVDVKPGGFPNSINPGSRGRIPVAVLTTDATDNTSTFDATTVDPLTVRFGTTGTEAAPVHYALEDVDGDGDVDLILHFSTQSTGIKCGDISVALTGETFEGQAIQGTDSIETPGCRRMSRRR